MNKIYEYYSTSLIKTVTVAVEICYTIGFTGSRRSIKNLGPTTARIGFSIMT